MKNLLSVLMFVVFILITPMSASALIIWDESIDGDLSIWSQGPQTLQVGTNTILGTCGLFRTIGSLPYADIDSLYLVLENGFQIVSVDAQITSAYGYGVDNYDRLASMRSPSNEYVLYMDMVAGTTHTYTFPYDEVGLYLLNAGSGGSTIEDEAEFYWDWKIDIEVSPVPEPSTILLLGSGLAGLAFYRRKRK